MYKPALLAPAEFRLMELFRFYPDNPTHHLAYFYPIQKGQLNANLLMDVINLIIETDENLKTRFVLGQRPEENQKVILQSGYKAKHQEISTSSEKLKDISRQVKQQPFDITKEATQQEAPIRCTLIFDSADVEAKKQLGFVLSYNHLYFDGVSVGQTNQKIANLYDRLYDVFGKPEYKKTLEEIKKEITPQYQYAAYAHEQLQYKNEGEKNLARAHFRKVNETQKIDECIGYNPSYRGDKERQEPDILCDFSIYTHKFSDEEMEMITALERKYKVSRPRLLLALNYLMLYEFNDRKAELPILRSLSENRRREDFNYDGAGYFAVGQPLVVQGIAHPAELTFEQFLENIKAGLTPLKGPVGRIAGEDVLPDVTDKKMQCEWNYIPKSFTFAFEKGVTLQKTDGALQSDDVTKSWYCPGYYSTELSTCVTGGNSVQFFSADRCYPEKFAKTMSATYTSILARLFRAHKKGEETISSILDMPIDQENKTPEHPDPKFGLEGYHSFFWGYPTEVGNGKKVEEQRGNGKGNEIDKPLALAFASANQGRY